MLANFISVKEELTGIKRYISQLRFSEKNILEEEGYFSVYSSGIMNLKTKPTKLTGSRIQNLGFREFEILSSKNLGNSEFWASFFSALRCGVFTVAVKKLPVLLFMPTVLSELG